jgi:hypothetical protein
MSKTKMIIVGGCTTHPLPNSKIMKCNKCGTNIAISGENIKRANQGVKVLCTKCGGIELGKAKKRQIIFPPKKELKQAMDVIMSDKKLSREFLISLIDKTICCKTCGTEIGHTMKQGGVLFNKTKIAEKDPKESKELKEMGETTEEELVEKMVS